MSQEFPTSTPIQDKILLMLNDQNVDAGKKFAKLFEQQSETTQQLQELRNESDNRHAENKTEMKDIRILQDIANETLLETKAKVELLEKKDTERMNEAVSHQLKAQAVEAVTKGVWMIPKPDWKSVAAIGTILTLLFSDGAVKLYFMILSLFSPHKS